MRSCGKMRVSWSVSWRLLVALMVLGRAAADQRVDDVENLLEDEPKNKSLQDLCSAAQPGSCVKMALVRGLERLSRWPSSMELVPGLTVGGDFSSLQDLPREVSGGQPEEALLRALTRYLSSMSLTVRVMDQGVVQRIHELGEKLVQPAEDSQSGRKKGKGSALLLAGLMSGGTMLAMGMAAIAAMAGKAMMAALMALMMSAMSAMKGGDKGGSSYEVIHAHDHKHRSLDLDADPSLVYPSLVQPPDLALDPAKSTLIPYIRRRRGTNVS